jgi:hypothetical protein
MRFYTESECEEWMRARKKEKPCVANSKTNCRLSYPAPLYRSYYWARWIASSITYQRPCLLWITEWDIWSSSENHHLYYRLRQSYHDYRLLHEAPGHFFLKHEVDDLASFLQLAMLFGWGGYVLTVDDDVNAFFRHDEYIEFYSDNQELIDEVQKALVSPAKPPGPKSAS